MVDRRDAGRHAVPAAGVAALLAGAAWRHERAPAALVACDVFYVLDVQLVTRTSAAGPAAGALRRRP